MCAPKIKTPEATPVAAPLPGAEETATFFTRDNGSRELTGEKAKARRGLSDLTVDLAPKTTATTGLQV